MGFPKNHHHTMGPSGCVKVSRGAGCCCAPWGGTSGSGGDRWVLPLPVHTLFLCQLKHYFSLSQAPATTLNLKACFGVICAGWRVTYCEHYIWLSPGGLLGKESNSRSSNLGDGYKAPAVCEVPGDCHIWGESWASGAVSVYANMIHIHLLTECRARDYTACFAAWVLL